MTNVLASVPRLFGIVAILSLALIALLRVIDQDAANRSERRLAQQEDCQADSIAILWRFPYQETGTYPRTFVPNQSAPAQPVTNCRRLEFQYLLETLEPTPLHYALQAHDKFYAINGNGNRDLVVHVSHVQPATSLSDPTIPTNLVTSFSAQELHRARLEFNGIRHPVENANFDRFEPRWMSPGFKTYFLSKQDAQPEFLGYCHFQVPGSCHVLVHSDSDGFAFGITFPNSEFDRLESLMERTLLILRKWRVSSQR